MNGEKGMDETTWRVVSSTEDLGSVTVTFAQTSWAEPSDPDDDDTEWHDADPDSRWAAWFMADGCIEIPMTVEQGKQFAVGRHYRMAFEEIKDAPGQAERRDIT